VDEPKYGTPEWDSYVAGIREILESEVGEVWDTSDLQSDFTVESFLAPMVFVTRKADDQRGIMLFQHSPRFYHSFTPRS